MSGIKGLASLLGTPSIGKNIFQLDQQNLLESCQRIKQEMRYSCLLDILIYEKENRLCAEYFFCFLENEESFVISVDFSHEDELPSLGKFWGNATFMEQEANELFGVKFSVKYSNILFHKEDRSYPMRLSSNKQPQYRDFDSNDAVNTSLMHSRVATQQIDLKAKWDHDLVKTSELISGKFFIGFERALRGKKMLEAMNLVESYFLERGAHYSLNFYKLIEFNNDIVLTDRAMALRMIEEEFLRINQHLILLRNLYFELKSSELYLSVLSKIKMIQSLIISFCGNEKFHNVNRIGGVRRDIDQSWMSRATTDLESVLNHLEKEYYKIKTSEVIKRTLEFSVIDKSYAFDKGLTGPVARSAGVNLDFRKSSPHYFYDEIDFDIPVGINGSGYDLFCVRFEEIFQSLKIIIQVLDNLPTGNIVNSHFGDIDDKKSKMDEFKADEYIKSTRLLNELPDTRGSFFSEGPNGHLGIHLKTSDSKISHLKFFSNDFNLKNSFEELAVGKNIDQLRLSWILLGIDMKSVER